MTRGRVAVGLVVILALLAVGGAPRARISAREWAVRRAPRPLSVLLVTLDTTRADHLGCYGVRATETPNLDRVAARGVVFERAYAHAPLTAPSHSSLLTGLIPARHGVHYNGSFVLPGDVPTLAEQFVRAGYRTGAFVSAFVLDRRFGLARGFATYEDDVLGGGRDRVDAEVRADVTVGRALGWLGKDDQRPFFAWVHLYDPHAFYEPPEPFASRYRHRPYDGEIAYMDTQVGRLLDAVAARGPTLIAVVADHGESLGEHGEPTHSYYVYEATQRVPLLLSLPGHLPQGVRVEPVVRGVDLMPTLLDLAGLPAPAGLDGRSLVPLVTGRSTESPGPAYVESYEPRLAWGARELLGLRDGRWLYVRSPRPELYDVEADPGARRNLASSRPQELMRLDGALTKVLEGARPVGAGAAVDAETTERLGALGYTAAGGTIEPTAAPLPDAKDNEPLLRGVAEGRDLIARKDVAAALAVLRRTLTLAPRSAAVREQLGLSLLDVGQPEEAAELFEALSSEQPGEERYWLGQAVAERRRGRTAEVRRVIDAGLAHLPTSARLHEERGRALLEARRVDEATGELREAVRLAPRQGAPRLRLGIALLASHRDAEAAAELVAAVALSPRSHEAKESAALLAGIGNRLLEEGQLEEASQAYRAALDGGEQAQDVYLNLGLARLRAGHANEALDAVAAGAGKWPESAELRYRSARLLADAGRAGEAEAAYRKALELEPDRLDAQAGLAALLDAHGRSGEATDLWRRVAATAGDRPEGLRARLALQGRD